MDLDSESRAARFVDALDTVRDLLARQCPDMQADPVGVSQLMSLICDEARHVVLTHVPGERAPGRIAHND